MSSSKPLFFYLILAGLLFCTNLSFSQTEKQWVHLVKDNAACLYGFKNGEDKWVIPPEYTSATYFVNGYSIVNKNETYGIVDVFGKKVVPVEYDYLKFLYYTNYGYSVWTDQERDDEYSIDGLFIASKDNKFGIINAANEIILSIDYYMVRDLENGYGIIRSMDTLYGFTDQFGRIIKPEYDEVYDFNPHQVAVVSKDGKYGVIDTLGKLIVPIEYDDIDFTKGSEYALIKKGEMFGLINPQGIVLNAEYEFVEINDLENIIVKKDGKYGVVDTLGRYNIFPQYDFMEPLNDTAAWFQTKGNTGILNKINGKIILKPEYEKYNADEIDSKYTLMIKGNKVYGFNVETLEFVKVDEVVKFEGKMARISKWKTRFQDALIDLNGTFVLAPHYFIRRAEGSFIYVDSSNNCGIIFDNGDKTIIKGEFKHIDFYFNGLAFVTGPDDKAGIIKQNGKLLIDPVFFAVSNYNLTGKYAWVMPNPPSDTGYKKGERIAWRTGKFGLVDSGNHYLLPPIYDFPAEFVNDRAILSINRKYGLIKRNGAIVLPFEFDVIIPQPNDLYIISKDEKKGLVNRDGKLILNNVYNDISLFKNGYAEIETPEGEGLIDSTGKIIIEPAPNGLSVTGLDLETLNYPGFEYYSETDSLNPLREFNNYQIAEAYITFSLLRFYKFPDMKRIINNTILSLVADHSYFEYSRPTAFERTLDIYSAKGRYYPGGFYSPPGNYTYSVDLLDQTDYTFCLDDVSIESTRMGSSYYHSFYNYVYFNNRFSYVEMDSLFDEETEYQQLLNGLLLEEIRHREDVTLDCTSPLGYYDYLKTNFSLSETGITVYFESDDEEGNNSAFITVLIPYKKLEKVGKKDGIIKYFLEVEGKKK